MILSFNMQYMVYIWLGVALLALFIESITTDMTSIWASASGLITMVVAIFCKILWVQIVIFAILSILLIILVRPFVKKYFKQNEIKTNSDGLIGKVGHVTLDIEPDGRGSVKVEGMEWTAISSNNEFISKNSKVEILAIEGVKLIVRALPEEKTNIKGE